ncbi:MAG: hypothetical protein ACRCWY_01415, partial [Cellulosilyticaceae bacterium]
KKLKDIIKTNKDPKDLAVATEEKRQYILKGMKDAIITEGYTLIVEDIATFLDIDEKQVRANIIPKLEYIRAPEGAADFFDVSYTPHMSFLEMRIKKWKRLFIQKESFEAFLKAYVMMYVPYTNICWHEKKGRYEKVGAGEVAIPYPDGIRPTFVRKCNIAPIIEARKTEDFIRKTKNDITYARQLGLISSERLQEEMAYLSNCKPHMFVQVHNQEIKNYVEKTPCYKFHLYKDLEDKEKSLYTTKPKDPLEQRVKPTVLYWFTSES